MGEEAKEKMTKKYRTARIHEDFYNLLKKRSQLFNTSLVEESENIANLTNTLGTKLGFDPSKIPFQTDKKCNLKLNKKVLIFK